jgi:hypothetical protein
MTAAQKQKTKGRRQVRDKGKGNEVREPTQSTEAVSKRI